MKIAVQRPTLNWGPAYEEASPVWLIVGRDVVVEAYISSTFTMHIKLPASAKIEIVEGEYRVTVPLEA